MFNDVITVYRLVDGKYVRKVFTNVYCTFCKQANVNKSGLVNANSVKIIIPTEEEIDFTIGKDLIVLGSCNLEIDNTNQERQSASLKHLKANNKVVTVNIVDNCLHGSLTHIEVNCN